MAKSIRNTTLNDVQDAAEEKIEDVQETVEGAVEDAKTRVNNLSLNQKLFAVAGITLIGSVVVQKLLERFRKPEVAIDGDIIVVEASDVS